MLITLFQVFLVFTQIYAAVYLSIINRISKVFFLAIFEIPKAITRNRVRTSHTFCLQTTWHPIPDYKILCLVCKGKIQNVMPVQSNRPYIFLQVCSTSNVTNSEVLQWMTQISSFQNASVHSRQCTLCAVDNAGNKILDTTEIASR